MGTINEFTEEYENCEETPFGSFEVKCSKCGSSNVDLDMSIGCSQDSGYWGSIGLVCMDCGNRFEIYRP